MSLSYHRPDCVEAAAELARDGGRILAGGQSLMPQIRRGEIDVGVLVDINRLPELDGIALGNGRIEIGALARLEAVRSDPLVMAHLPLLAAALAWVANPGIRARGTLVGNLMHGAPGAEAVAAAALADAELVYRSGGERLAAPLGLVPPGVFAVAARLRPSPAGTRAGFYEVQRRFGHLGTLGCGVTIARDGTVEAVFSGLLDAPLVASHLARALTRGDRSDTALHDALARDLGGRSIRSDLHATARYRWDVAPAVARRALEMATGRAAGP